MKPQLLPVYTTDDYPRLGCSIAVEVGEAGWFEVTVAAPLLGSDEKRVIEAYAMTNLEMALELVRKFLVGAPMTPGAPRPIPVDG